MGTPATMNFGNFSGVLAMKEFKLSDHNPETILFATSAYFSVCIYIYIYVGPGFFLQRCGEPFFQRCGYSAFLI